MQKLMSYEGLFATRSICRRIDADVHFGIKGYQGIKSEQFTPVCHRSVLCNASNNYFDQNETDFLHNVVCESEIDNARESEIISCVISIVHKKPT